MKSVKRKLIEKTKKLKNSVGVILLTYQLTFLKPKKIKSQKDKGKFLQKALQKYQRKVQEVQTY